MSPIYSNIINDIEEMINTASYVQRHYQLGGIWSSFLKL